MISHGDLFLKAMGCGLAVAAPVGPMALLCMRRTLVRGWKYGLATGGGIAFGDACYALVAALGLSGVSSFMLTHERILHAVAGLFLIYLGIKTFRSHVAADGTAQADARPLSAWPSVFGSSVLLTLTNPPTIIMFAAIFTVLAPHTGFTLPAALATVGGVFAGSLLWWVGVTAVVLLMRGAIGPRIRLWIDRIAGVTLAAFGALELRKASH